MAKSAFGAETFSLGGDGETKSSAFLKTVEHKSKQGGVGKTYLRDLRLV